MIRHTIAAQLGPLDQLSIPVAPGERLTMVDLLSGNKRLGYGLGAALEDLNTMNIFPSETGLDLAVVAGLVHLADTRISRKTESQDTWTREIKIIAPVHDPALWTATASLLSRTLNFLSGDKWTIEFRPRPAAVKNLVRQRPPNAPQIQADSLSLFSGGLDSLIGAIDLLESKRQPLLISHAADGATSKAQTDCFDELSGHYQAQRPQRLRLWMEFPAGIVENVASEKTTRARSFLFIALGSLAGSGFGGAFELQVPENGLIALNVPLDILRLGSLSTRTTHPFYMARWNELLGKLKIVGRVNNPYWSRTKGEMVAECTNVALLRGTIAKSLSCSAPTKGRWKGLATQHCGYCLPCLIRRAAIRHAFGSRRDSTPYTVSNLRSQVLDTRQAEGRQVRSFQLAAQRLREAPELARLLIHKPGLLTDVRQDVDRLADVYRRGLAEVDALLKGVRARPA